MQIKNTSPASVVFIAALPSGKNLRIHLEGGETVSVSNAVAMGLPANTYFQNLIGQGKLSLTAPDPSHTL